MKKPTPRAATKPAPESVAPTTIELNETLADLFRSDLACLIENASLAAQKDDLRETVRLLDIVRYLAGKLIEYQRGPRRKGGGK
jgi:hypothetical protein